MAIKLALLVFIGVMLVMVFGWVLGRRRALRARQVGKLKNPEWSATVYCCAESRAEF